MCGLIRVCKLWWLRTLHFHPRFQSSGPGQFCGMDYGGTRYGCDVVGSSFQECCQKQGCDDICYTKNLTKRLFLLRPLLSYRLSPPLFSGFCATMAALERLNGIFTRTELVARPAEGALRPALTSVSAATRHLLAQVRVLGSFSSSFFLACQHCTVTPELNSIRRSRLFQQHVLQYYLLRLPMPGIRSRGSGPSI